LQYEAFFGLETQYKLFKAEREAV